MRNKILKDEKNWTTCFFCFFFEIAPKKVSRGTPSTLSTPQSVYEEDLAEETAEKKIKIKKSKESKKSENQKKIKKKIGQVFF